MKNKNQEKKNENVIKYIKKSKLKTYERRT